MLNWRSRRLWSRPSSPSTQPEYPLALPVSPEPSGKKPDEPRSAVLAVRVATIDDLVLALRINRHKGGEGRTWCRIIGDWYKSKLIGVVGVLGDEPATFILGNLKGRYFHI